MLSAILISWATLGLTLPIAKALGVVDRVVARKRQGKKSSLRDIVGDVRHMQAAENKAYEQAASALCGGKRAPGIAVAAAKLAMKGLTSYATPGPTDFSDGGSTANPKRK